MPISPVCVNRCANSNAEHTEGRREKKITPALAVKVELRLWKWADIVIITNTCKKDIIEHMFNTHAHHTQRNQVKGHEGTVHGSISGS